MPEVAVGGTAHEPDTAQLPQSIRPVEACVRQFGWFCGRAGRRRHGRDSNT